MKVRVLHVLGSLDRGGLECWLLRVVPHLANAGVETEICLLSGRRGILGDDFERQGVRLHHCPIRPSWTWARRFRKLLRERRYDVVHSHVWEFSGKVLSVATQSGIHHCIAHSHNTSGGRARTLMRTLYSMRMRSLLKRYATIQLACSCEAGRALFGTSWSHGDKSRVIHNSIDIGAFRPPIEGVSKESFGLPSPTPVIGTVGSLTPQKNHAFFLQVAAEFIRRQRTAVFMIAGSGPLESSLRAEASRLGVETSVHFLGSRHDVPALMGNVFDAMLFPSLYEGLGVVLVEAAACGLPVLCSNVIPKVATDVLPQAFTRLGLDEAPARWADTLEDILRRGRIDADLAYRTVATSAFVPDVAAQHLLQAYGYESRQ